MTALEIYRRALAVIAGKAGPHGGVMGRDMLCEVAAQALAEGAKAATERPPVTFDLTDKDRAILERMNDAKARDRGIHEIVTVIDAGIVKQTIDGAVTRIADAAAQQFEDGTRQALINLGWTPPADAKPAPVMDEFGAYVFPSGARVFAGSPEAAAILATELGSAKYNRLCREAMDANVTKYLAPRSAPPHIRAESKALNADADRQAKRRVRKPDPSA